MFWSCTSFLSPSESQSRCIYVLACKTEPMLSMERAVLLTVLFHTLVWQQYKRLHPWKAGMPLSKFFSFEMLEDEEPFFVESESNDPILVAFYMCCRLVKNLERTLERWALGLCLKSVGHLGPRLAGDWLSQNNGKLLYAHAILTWLLIAYRIYRNNRNGHEKVTDGLRRQRIDSSSERSSVAEYSVNTGMEAALECEVYWSSSECITTSKSKVNFSPGSSSMKVAGTSSNFVRGSKSFNFFESKNREESLDITDALELKNTKEKMMRNESFQSMSDEDIDHSTIRRRSDIYDAGVDTQSGQYAEDWEPPVTPKNKFQKEFLVNAVKNILLFRSLDADQIKKVVDAMQLTCVRQGETLIRQGDEGDNFYVIESGVYEAGIESVDGTWSSVKRYDGKGSFGELALMYSQPRAATVRCLESGKLWTLDRRSFKTLVLQSAQEKRMLYDNFLMSVPILSSLTDYERHKLADALVTITFGKGDTVIKEGDPSDGMYFIHEGEAVVTKKEAEGVLIKLGRGEYFGELGLLNRKPRAATVTAATPLLRTAYLEREAFERLLGPCIDLMKRDANERYSLHSFSLPADRLEQLQ